MLILQARLKCVCVCKADGGEILRKRKRRKEEERDNDRRGGGRVGRSEVECKEKKVISD
jgi:hypothetical protein